MTALWLARRELSARRARVALAAAVVAALAAASVALELLARARESDVAARLDLMGAPLAVVPAGAGPSALARLDLGAGALPEGTAAAVERALGRDLRVLAGRRVVRAAVNGVETAVVGTSAAGVPPAAEIGSELARRLGRPASVALGDRTFPVAGVRPSTATAEDLAAFVPLEVAEALAAGAAPGPNLLLVYLAPGVSSREAAARLETAGLPAAVVRAERGEVADGKAQGALARHRGAAHLAVALLALVCLAIAAHLDAQERRVELATLAAIGAPRATLLGALLLRSALVAAAGAAAGVAAGLALAAAQEPAVTGAIAHAAPLAGATLAFALAVGAAAAAPTALAAALRDPVAALQD